MANELFDDLLGAIGGGVVADDDLEGKVELIVVPALGQRVSEIGFAIVRRDANAEFDAAQRLISWL